MKLLVKPLKGGEFTLESVELTNTVLEVKEMIQKSKGEADFPIAGQKLIHGGKMMKDDKTLADYNVKEEGGFIVCMVSTKKRAAPKPAPAAAAPTQAPATGVAATGGPPPLATTNAPAAAPAAAAAPVIREEDVQYLMGMGFADADVRAALQAAGGNAQGATELLLNPGLLTEAQNAQNAANDNPLEQFRFHPQINQLRAMVQNNPAVLQTIIQQIATMDPRLHAAIQADQETFVQILNEPIPEGANTEGADGMAGMAGMGGGVPTPQQLQHLAGVMAQMRPEDRQAFAQQMGIDQDQLERMTQMFQNISPQDLQRLMQDMMAARGAGGMGGGMGGGQAPGQNVVQLTEAENQSINNLVELGFARHHCIEAYIACDKDENAAANLLFNTPFEDDNPPNPPPQ